MDSCVYDRRMQRLATLSMQVHVLAPQGKPVYMWELHGLTSWWVWRGSIYRISATCGVAVSTRMKKRHLQPTLHPDLKVFGIVLVSKAR